MMDIWVLVFVYGLKEKVVVLVLQKVEEWLKEQRVHGESFY